MLDHAQWHSIVAMAHGGTHVRPFPLRIVAVLRALRKAKVTNSCDIRGDVRTRYIA